MATVSNPAEAFPPTLPPLHDGGTPAFEVAYLFPPQGAWTENDYNRLESTLEGPARIELSDGRLEVLPVPTELHEIILIFYLEQLKAFVKAHAPGIVLASGVKLRLKSGLFRKADVVYMKKENFHRRHNEYWEGADLAMEVVSGTSDDRRRDWEKKPEDYADANVAEYWIVDPDRQVVRVLALDGDTYRVHGDFGPGTQATSVLLPGFAVSVDTLLLPPDARREP